MFQTSPRVPRPVLDLPEGPPTRTKPLRGSNDPSRTSTRDLDLSRTFLSDHQLVSDLSEDPPNVADLP